MKLKMFAYTSLAAAAALTLTLAACGGGSGNNGLPLIGVGANTPPAALPNTPAEPPAQEPVDPLAKAPTDLRTTWFGISNWHYQVGDLGFILDGEVVNSGRTPNPAAVKKALTALTKRGTVDFFLVGHEHGDHALQIPEYAKQTGKPIYAPAAVCAAVLAYGNPGSQCTTLKGGETLKMNDFVTVRVVRWLHSLDCGQAGNGTAGVETFGFLVTAQTKNKDRVLTLYASDSGAGGVDLFIPRVVGKGTPSETVYGAPFSNLADAVRASKVPNIDVWQGGPESRVVNQARVLMPAFGIKYFQPHHLGTRATLVDGVSVGYKLEYGLHFPYLESEVPLLTAFMKSNGTTPMNPSNYFDAWVLDAAGFRPVDNADVKADYGLPATGPGPGKQGPNPRSGQLECVND
ncbi:L-ascorbate metabolism protein UlaG (beta-lactamase superfamily) [Variovorax boronicumulans]|uniref:MBL fold metallo-hydrolase n=1 Tax=Variovorax boronicumulans TaxID=436515 RepID=UPI0027837B01|nr:hypothetical protein [Variovorax boronicumulans]MDP9996480.1 L-ascorbate metabolism protein UlaG (beta-lactamase superfamily) [Variovorax boronicumulans]MDQ0007792.1 L-ascorbate metabolism protein UlaG (beta-lactamase superfamily) [Variovorax boronicumulans]